MKTLEDELKGLGFSDDLVKVMRTYEYLNVQGMNVEDFHFQDYENGMVSSADISINEESNTSNNYFIKSNV
jgi:cyanate lyase